ncbi:response regulator transcription factor [Paenibacillus eucommiae]|uniref:Two-component system response regulator YesN n=1 Tax=Paenibacillus eucommiae TaxID=1355755 RepID=A0ABS4J861_9BACL|nr:response regulator transcription factor [Paenibacillus eucommiae]MBP1996038.1 two-component system response regulator YesN [Paenibacillus eucommiae]
MYKILLVDDEPLILEGLEHLIKWEEYGIEIVGKVPSGEEAIAFLKRKQVDIVLTDIRMPGLSGLDVIEFVKSQEMNTRCMILSGYDEFEYVKKAAMLGIDNYLLKPVNKEELSATLLSVIERLEKQASSVEKQRYVREALDILRDNVLVRLVSDTISQQDFMDKCLFLNIDFDYEFFITAIIRKSKNHLTGDQLNSHDDELIHYGLRNICEEMIMRDIHLTGLVFQDTEDDIVLLFMDEKGLDPLQVKSLLQETIVNIQSFLKQDVFVTMGTMECGQGDIHVSYDKAKQLQHYSLIYPVNQVIHVSDIDLQRDRREGALEINFEQLEAAFLKREKEEAASIIQSIYKQMEQMEHKTPSLVQNVTIEIMFHLIRSSKGSSSNNEQLDINGKTALIHILSKKTMSEISEAIVESIHHMIDYKDKNENPMIQKVLKTIAERYSSEISLQSLADTFFINSAYLGQLFKKETGQLFTSYLNQYRIERAKELLMNRALSAKQIALEVGYPNADYFYKVFKKTTGVYPSEYKQ